MRYVNKTTVVFVPRNCRNAMAMTWTMINSQIVARQEAL